MKQKKRVVGFSIAVVALAICGALSYAWFTSTIDPIKTDVTTARIQIEGTDGEWTIDSDPALLNKALPGETVKTSKPFTVENKSNREAVAKIDITDVQGELKLANQSATGNQKFATGALTAAINGSSLTPSEKTALIAQIKTDVIVVNKALVDCLSQPATTGPMLDHFIAQGSPATVATLQDVLNLRAGIQHFYDQLVAMGDNLTTGITDTLDSYSIDYVVVPDATTGKNVTYVALGVPVIGTNDVLDFDLSYKIPEALGGEISTAGTNYREDGRSYNWEKWLNEQESTFSYTVGVKAVQGTERAITDVFGANVTNAFMTHTNPDISNFLTNY